MITITVNEISEPYWIYKQKATMIHQWKYYNRALIPLTPPHESPNMSNFYEYFNKRNILFARYTTDYDLNYETEWWYCIKENSFDIDLIKSKRRYEIIKGCKNFYCEINKEFTNYADDLYKIACEAFSEYPENYRPEINKDSFFTYLKQCETDLSIDFILCKNKDEHICGYAILEKNKNCVNLQVVKTLPSCQKLGINAAIVKFILDTYLPEYYICDGERPLRHRTNYQEYLIKYFQFRKAYCILHIHYKTWLKIIIFIIFPLRSLLTRLSRIYSNKILYNIISILEQERIRRTFI